MLWKLVFLKYPIQTFDDSCTSTSITPREGFGFGWGFVHDDINPTLS